MEGDAAPGRERRGLRGHRAAERGARTLGELAGSGDRRHDLALERRPVDAALPGDGEHTRAHRRVQPDRLGHPCAAGDEARTERREGGAEPAGRTRARKVGDWAQLRHRGEAALELLDRCGAGALLGPEDPRRAALAEQRVGDVGEDGRRHGQLPNDGAQAGAAVHRRAAAEAHQRARGAGRDGGEEELAGAAARGGERIALARWDEGETDRLRHLDDGASIGEQEEGRLRRPAERIRDGGTAPAPPERPCEHLRRPFASIGQRELGRFPSRASHA